MPTGEDADAEEVNLIRETAEANPEQPGAGDEARTGAEHQAKAGATTTATTRPTRTNGRTTTSSRSTRARRKSREEEDGVDVRSGAAAGAADNTNKISSECHAF